MVMPERVVAPARERHVADLVDLQQESQARDAEGVEGAGLDQRLHRAAIEHHRVHAAHEVVDGAEAAVALALGDDLLDQRLADVAHRGESEEDRAGPGRGSVRTRRRTR